MIQNHIQKNFYCLINIGNENKINKQFQKDLNQFLYFQYFNEKRQFFQYNLSCLDRLLQQTPNKKQIYFDLVSENIDILKQNQNKEINSTLLGTNIYDVIYSLPPMSISIICFDFRNIDQSLKYNDVWQLQMLIDQNLAFDDDFDLKIQKNGDDFLTNFFLNNSNKNIEHIFTIQSLDNLTLRTKIQLKDLKYISYKYQFANSIRFKQISANRSNFGEQKQFGFIISNTNNDSPQNLPLNIKNQDWGTNPPKYFLDYIYNQSYVQINYYNANAKQNAPSFDQVFMQNTLTTIIIPYLPYFINCQGFNQYIPLTSLIEQSNYCVLNNTPQNTIPIGLYDFSQNPNNSDVCDKIELQCINSEVGQVQSKDTIWYKLDKDKVIFKMTKKPLSADQMISPPQIQDYIDNIFVKVKTNYQINKVPTQVTLNLGYYQKTNSFKELVEGVISFEKFIKPTQNQINGDEIFYYTLTIKYQPYSHTQLINNFALDTSVYMIALTGVGMLAVILTIVYAIFIYFTQLRKKKRQYHVFILLQLLWKEAFIGLVYSTLPMTIYMILLSIITRGYILQYQIFTICTDKNQCDPTSDNLITYLDYYFDLTQNFQPSLSKFNMRTGRIGVLFFLAGIQIILKAADLQIIEKSKINDNEDLIGNYQQIKHWKKSNLIYVQLMLVIILCLFIGFTQTTLFSNNNLIISLLFKPFLEIIEFLSEQFIADKLLNISVGITLPTIEGFSGYGAPDFIEMIFAFIFGGAAMNPVIRPFFLAFMKVVCDTSQEYYEIIQDFIMQKLKQSNNDEEDGNNKNEMNKSNELINNENDKDQNSEIILYDLNQNNSYYGKQQNEISYDEQDLKSNSAQSLVAENQLIKKKDGKAYNSINNLYQNYINQVNQNESIDLSVSQKDEYDIYEQQIKKLLKQNQVKNNKISSNQSSFKKQEESKTESEKEFEFIDDSLEYICSFTNDISANMMFPFFFFYIWLFYDETGLMTVYGIYKSNILIYQLFAIIQIPFQIPQDLIYMNINMSQFDFDFTIYLLQKQKVFENRQNNWVLHDQNFKPGLEKMLQTLDAVCKTSQFFFINQFHTYGVLLVILGVIINANIISSYNPFNDFYLFPICIIFYLINEIYFQIIFFIGNKLKIFHVKKKEENQQLDSNHQQQQNSNQEQQQKHEKYQKKFNLKIDLQEDLENQNEKLKIQNFQRYQVIQKQEKQVLNFYAEQKQKIFEDLNYRKKFVERNKKWLVEKQNLETIFTPTTLQFQRNNILQSFEKIYGKIELDINQNNENKQDQKDTFNTLINQRVKKQDFNKNTQNLLKFWLYRARKLKWINAQIGGLVEIMIKKQCQYCGSTWGLRGKIINDVEYLFKKFIIEQQKNNEIPEVNQNEKSITVWNVDKWQDYFKKNVILKTICFICTEKLSQKVNKNKIQLCQ